MAIGCAKTRNQTRARECWFPVPIVAPVGPPVNFLQHFRDRQKALQRGFAPQAWGSGTQRTAESLSDRIAQFTLQAIYHRVFNHVTESGAWRKLKFPSPGRAPRERCPTVRVGLPQSAIAGEKGARIGAVAKRRLRPGDAATAGERGLLDG
jgi:hypothetical protein